MANTTPAAIITTVAQAARMQEAAASADRARILGWLQEAVDIIAMDVGAIHDATPTVVTLTSGTSQYDLTAAPFAISGFITIDEMRLTDASGANMPITQIPMASIDYVRSGAQAAATPLVYAVDYPMIVFYPTPGAGATVEVKGTVNGPTLADDSTAITFIPSALQYGCLQEWALYRAHQYKQDGLALDHLNHFNNSGVNGIRAARRWISQVGGRQPVARTGMQRIRTSPSQDMGWR